MSRLRKLICVDGHKATVVGSTGRAFNLEAYIDAGGGIEVLGASNGRFLVLAAHLGDDRTNDQADQVAASKLSM